jgi:hypothetical protein
MKSKRFLFLALVLFCASDTFSEAKFSFWWENSFLTGKGTFIEEQPEDYDVEREIKGGQILFTFRCQLNEYFSLGAGSGANVNKLNASFEFWGTYHFSVGMFYVPIFVEARALLPVYNDLLSFYGGSKIGGSLAPVTIEGYSGWEYYFTGGFFLEPALGISVSHKRFLLDFGVGYHLQTSKFVEYNDGAQREYSDYKEELFEYPFVLNQFFLKLSVGVLLGKNNK